MILDGFWFKTLHMLNSFLANQIIYIEEVMKVVIGSTFFPIPEVVTLKMSKWVCGPLLGYIIKDDVFDMCCVQQM